MLPAAASTHRSSARRSLAPQWAQARLSPTVASCCRTPLLPPDAAGVAAAGTVAGHAALTYPGGALGALIFGCSVLLDLTPTDTAAGRSAMPVFVFTAEHDQEYLPKFQQRCS